MFLTLRRAFPMFVLVLTAVLWPVESDAAQLTLTWTDNSTNEDGFAIERKTGPTGTFAQIGTVGSNVTSYIDSALASLTTYCYRIVAFNGAGNSAYSGEACGTTPQTFGLAVVRAGLGSGTVTSAPAGITCGTSCSGSYASGTAVTLTAAPMTNSIFTGWSGPRVWAPTSARSPCPTSRWSPRPLRAGALDPYGGPSGRRQWDGDDHTRGHPVRDHLLRELRQRNRRDTHGVRPLRGLSSAAGAAAAALGAAPAQ